MKIREKDKLVLLRIFDEMLPDSLVVWAYGSRVNGTAHDGSDLDLVIRTADLQPLDMEIYTTLREKIRESNVAILVELRDWARLPSRFHEQIVKKHEVFYPNS